MTAENHPLMQQYYLIEYEWARDKKLSEIEAKMFNLYFETVKKSNTIIESSSPSLLPSTDKKSLFWLEAIFLQKQKEFYSQRTSSEKVREWI
jgi:hypothetical protein